MHPMNGLVCVATCNLLVLQPICVATCNLVMNLFRQLKEEEKKKKLSKALPAEQVAAMASASESEDGSDEVTNATVNSNLQLLICPMENY
ncbi:hypothetical protein Vadar_029529 [Vaccinium darrowii]|uniref:Uncharacterized protein n=1 Tax=Vaccinium darrowii TaxID=229202 RepID=A0ACB7YAY1_9ERIC|nr:hypothetical protein Vadar_029529 [Vaccinium darrowii]